jgi:hypothetical protein
MGDSRQGMIPFLELEYSIRCCNRYRVKIKSRLKSRGTYNNLINHKT